MDYYNAERLEAETPGVKLIAELAATITDLGLASVAYIAPVNHEMLKTTLGDAAVSHLVRNAEVIETAYLPGLGGRGPIANAVCLSPSKEFVDPVHLTYAGQERLARHIADLSPPAGSLPMTETHYTPARTTTGSPRPGVCCWATSCTTGSSVAGTNRCRWQHQRSPS